MIDFMKLRRRISRLTGSDWLTIRRRADGQETEINAQPIPCCAVPHSQDNPDPSTVLAQPVITSIMLYAPPETDIQNGDFLVVQRINNTTKEVIDIWGGICGQPYGWKPFKTVNMQMSSLGTDIKPPAPPPKPSESMIYIHFLNEEHVQIHGTITHRAAQGILLEIPHLELDGYVFDYAVLDGDKVGETGEVGRTDETETVASVSFKPKNEYHNITFFYQGAKMPTDIKMLINSAFRKANGTLGNGLHLYNNMPVRFLGEEGGLVFVEVTSGLTFEHDTTFRRISISTSMNNNNANTLVVYPAEASAGIGEWFRVASIQGRFLYLMPYTPTAAEMGAYRVPF